MVKKIDNTHFQVEGNGLRKGQIAFSAIGAAMLENYEAIYTEMKHLISAAPNMSPLDAAMNFGPVIYDVLHDFFKPVAHLDEEPGDSSDVCNHPACVSCAITRALRAAAAESNESYEKERAILAEVGMRAAQLVKLAKLRQLAKASLLKTGYSADNSGGMKASPEPFRFTGGACDIVQQTVDAASMVERFRSAGTFVTGVEIIPELGDSAVFKLAMDASEKGEDSGLRGFDDPRSGNDAKPDASD